MAKHIAVWIKMFALLDCKQVQKVCRTLSCKGRVLVANFKQHDAIYFGWHPYGVGAVLFSSCDRFNFLHSFAHGLHSINCQWTIQSVGGQGKFETDWKRTIVVHTHKFHWNVLNTTSFCEKSSTRVHSNTTNTFSAHSCLDSMILMILKYIFVETYQSTLPSVDLSGINLESRIQYTDVTICICRN